MKKLLIFTFVFIGFLSSTFGQDLNSYKYVIVPSSFEFLREPNQYQLNELTKFLFEKYGFEVYMDEELPAELIENRCKALIANVKKESGLFSTKLVVVLKDCKNNQLFISKEGSSREKDYKTAYQEALRDAFESISALNYKYDGQVSVAPAPKSENVVQLVIIPETKAEPTAQENMPAEVEVSILPVSKDQTVKNSKNENKVNFLYETKAFYLKRSDNGYIFFQKGMTEPFAELIASKNNQTYFYTSITSQGIATFDKVGNLVVEIFIREKGLIDTKVYKLQD